MARVPFPFPKSSTPGARPGEGEGRLINWYSVTEGDRSYLRRSPGLASLVSTSGSGIRGMLPVNDSLYVVYGNTVVKITGTSVSALGSIPGTDGVTIARNNRVTGGASTPDVVAVRETGGAYVITSGVSGYPDSDLPSTVNSVDFMGGYFLFSIPDGRLFASELNSTDIEALSFTTAESRADGLVRVAVQGSLAYAFGSSTIEPYQNVGLSPFPLQRAATVVPVGLLTPMAVAGFQEAWNGPMVLVASDRTVKLLQGYETQTISSPDVERFIAASSSSSISVDVFVWAGRQCVTVASDQGTWVYDIGGQRWHERQTGSAAWRALRSAYFNNQWVLGDRLSGAILKLIPEPAEVGQAMTGLIQSGPLKEFPSRVATRFASDFTEADAEIFISWSHDGGKSWSTEITRSLSQAEKWPPSVSNLGLSTHHGIIVRVRCTTAENFSFSGASAERLAVRAA